MLLLERNFDAFLGLSSSSVSEEFIKMEMQRRKSRGGGENINVCVLK